MAQCEDAAQFSATSRVLATQRFCHKKMPQEARIDGATFMENLQVTSATDGHISGAPEAGALGAWVNAATESKGLNNFRGPGAPLIQFDRFLSLAENAPVRIDVDKAMDFGCGAGRPFSISTLLYLFGAREVVALDVVAYDETQAPSIAKNLWLLLMIMLAGESGLEYSKLYNRKLIESRVCDFDMDALRAGRLSEGLPGAIQQKAGDYVTLADEIGSIDLVLSNSVFEHVASLRETMRLLRTHMAPSGFVYSDIDYRDHRQYVKATLK